MLYTPRSVYGLSKLLDEVMLRKYAARHPALRWVSLRYGNVCGADPAGCAAATHHRHRHPPSAPPLEHRALLHTATTRPAPSSPHHLLLLLLLQVRGRGEAAAAYADDAGYVLAAARR